MKNEWVVLSLKMPYPISNSTSFQNDENETIILGGGCDNDFCHDLITINFEN